MNLLNNLRWVSGLFTGSLNWTPTGDRTIVLPDDSVTLLGDDRPIGALNAGVSLRGYEPIITVTATKTLVLADSGTVQNCTNAAAAIITIPLNSAVAFPIGTRIIVRKTTAQTVTIDWSVGVTVLNSLGATLTVIAVASVVVLRKTGTDAWIATLDPPETAIGAALRTAVDAPSAKSTIGLSAVTNVLLAEPRASGIQIGTNAGLSNTTSTGWVAVGSNAGRLNSTGTKWTAIGDNAGYNCTGGEWTSIGHSAGFSATTTQFWTAIGAFAGFSCVSPDNWVAIGNSAGYSATGQNWTAVGTLAGSSCTTSASWTAVGYVAGRFATGQDWTAIGTASGFDITTGSSNTTIGYNTGRGVTTGSGNTIVGAGVVGLAAGLTNNVILASGDGVIKLQIDATGLATLPISPIFSDSSTLVATTAHVKNVLTNSPSISGASLAGVFTITPSATQVLTATSTVLSNAGVLRVSSASAITLTSNPQLAVGVNGQRCTLINVGAFAITIVTGNGLTLYRSYTLQASGGSITLSYSTDLLSWVMFGSAIGDSFALAGNPTTSTQVFSDNSTIIATTAHVKNVLANSPSITLAVLRWVSGAFLGSLSWVPTAARSIAFPDSSGTVQLNGAPTTTYQSVVTVTATKTLALADFQTYQYCTNAAAITVTIPTNATVAFVVGSEIEIKKGGAGALSIAIVAGVILLRDGGAAVTTPFALTKNAIFKKVAVDSWIMEGA